MKVNDFSSLCCLFVCFNLKNLQEQIKDLLTKQKSHLQKIRAFLTAGALWRIDRKCLKHWDWFRFEFPFGFWPPARCELLVFGSVTDSLLIFYIKTFS